MTRQQYLTVNGGNSKKSSMIKTYSFTTDDDDAGMISNPSPVSNHEKLISLNSPSIDSYNNEDDSSENGKKLRKRKSRRQTELENPMVPEKRKLAWYKKISLSNLLFIIGVIIFIYVMWIKRDIWIHRLLKSNVRVRRSVIIKDDKTIDSSPKEEDIIENIEEKNVVEINNEEDKEDLASSTKSTDAEKINLRVRRNKMNFNKEDRKKKRRSPQNSSIDDDEEDQPVLLSLSSSTKKKNQQRSLIAKENSTMQFSTHDDIIEQLRKTLKSRRRERNFFSKLSKTTGLNKDQLYQFIYKKNYQFITLPTFIALLDSFDLILLIVPK